MYPKCYQGRAIAVGFYMADPECVLQERDHVTRADWPGNYAQDITPFGSLPTNDPTCPADAQGRAIDRLEYKLRYAQSAIEVKRLEAEIKKQCDNL